MASPTAHGMRVFPAPEDTTDKGGNPTVIFLNASSLSDSQMQALTQASHHECGFVTEGPERGEDGVWTVTIRYWVPEHEMEMCGHATIGALWVLNKEGLLPKGSDVRVKTLAGVFEGRVDEEGVRVGQPRGEARVLEVEEVRKVVRALGIREGDLDGEVQNARTARVKTLVPVGSLSVLNGIKPVQGDVRRVCEEIGSTGLYPFTRATVDLEEAEAAQKQKEGHVFSARQFPKSSGYLEDPATGIAATALVCGLTTSGKVNGGVVRVRQGWEMGMPSEIRIMVRGEEEEDGYWMMGEVVGEDVDQEVLALL